MDLEVVVGVAVLEVVNETAEDDLIENAPSSLSAPSTSPSRRVGASTNQGRSYDNAVHVIDSPDGFPEPIRE